MTVTVVYRFLRVSLTRGHLQLTHTYLQGKTWVLASDELLRRSWYTIGCSGKYYLTLQVQAFRSCYRYVSDLRAQGSGVELSFAKFASLGRITRFGTCNVFLLHGVVLDLRGFNEVASQEELLEVLMPE